MYNIGVKQLRDLLFEKMTYADGGLSGAFSSICRAHDNQLRLAS